MEANSQIKSKPSSAYSPDLDWSQVRETISMICLSVVQIETSLKESSVSMGKLTENFTTIATEASDINSKVQSNSEDAQQAIIDSTKTIQGKVTESITSFQFYDRITQRLEHVTQGLMNLNHLIGDPSCLYNPQAWKSIQESIKNSYSMECERMMFEHIMEGATVEEALEIFNRNYELRQTEANKDDEEDEDIELF